MGFLDRIISSSEDFERFAPEDLPQDILAPVYRYWLKLAQAAEARGSGLPDKAEIDFLKLRDYLGFIGLVQRKPDGGEFRYLSVGGQLIALYGRKLAGRSVREALGERISREPLKTYARAAAERRPLYSRRMLMTWRRIVGYDRLLLPFTDGGEDVVMLMLCIAPTDRNILKASDWREQEDVRHWLENLESQP